MRSQALAFQEHRTGVRQIVEGLQAPADFERWIGRESFFQRGCSKVADLEKLIVRGVAYLEFGIVELFNQEINAFCVDGHHRLETFREIGDCFFWRRGESDDRVKAFRRRADGQQVPFGRQLGGFK